MTYVHQYPILYMHTYIIRESRERGHDDPMQQMKEQRNKRIGATNIFFSLNFFLFFLFVFFSRLKRDSPVNQS